MRLSKRLVLSVLSGIVCAVISVNVVYSLISARSKSILFDGNVFGEMHVQSCGVQAYLFSIAQLKLSENPRAFRELLIRSDANLGLLQLGEIAKSLKQSGASINAFITKHPSGTLDDIDSSAVAIIHLNPRNSGHFVALTRYQDGDATRFIMKDGVVPPQIVTKKYLTEHVLDKASGHIVLAKRETLLGRVIGFTFPKFTGLLTRDNETPNESNANSASITDYQVIDNFKLPRTIVHNYDPNDTVAAVKVKLENQSEKSIVIEGVKGSCSCFVGTSLRFPLVLKQDSELGFDANFSIAKLQRNAPVQLLISNDANQRKPFLVSLDFVALNSKLPFFLNARSTVGIINSKKLAESTFFLLREMKEGKGSSSVQSIARDTENGEATLISTKEVTIGGLPFNIDSIRLRLVKPDPGYNFIRAIVKTVAGNVIPIEMSVYVNN